MTKKKLLAWAVVAVIGGLAMTSIASATTTVTPLAGETVNYTLNWNENFSAWVLQIDDWETRIFILDKNLWATAAGTGCEDSSWSNACPEVIQHTDIIFNGEITMDLIPILHQQHEHNYQN